MPADYYTVLGVARTATVAEIRSAFRRAVLRWHPDRLPLSTSAADRANAAVRCDHAVAASRCLLDPIQRAKHDAVAHIELVKTLGRVSDTVILSEDFERVDLDEEAASGNAGTAAGDAVDVVANADGDHLDEVTAPETAGECDEKSCAEEEPTSKCCEKEQEYTYECRCGGVYVVVLPGSFDVKAAAAQVAEGIKPEVVHAECDSCSLLVAVELA